MAAWVFSQRICAKARASSRARALVRNSKLVSSDSCVGEEERRRNVQRLGDAHQPAGGDAVRARLVFLHLLEGEFELDGKGVERQAKFEPAGPNAAPDLNVLRITR